MTNRKGNEQESIQLSTREDSDQPPHLRSLIRVFADRMCPLQRPSYPKMDKREPLLYWVVVQADLRSCWSHRSCCRFCRALAHIYCVCEMSNPFFFLFFFFLFCFFFFLKIF